MSITSAEVVVIGGGVIGASVAWHLTQAGCRDVLVIEREQAQGLGSTGRATGGVRAQFATPINVRMSLFSIDFLANFNETTGHESGYEPRGYLFLATSEQQLAVLEANRRMQIELGLKNVEMVTPQDIAGVMPQLRTDDLTGGSFCQTDGFINALAVMKGLTTTACERGTRIMLDTEVTGIEIEAGRVAGVQTNKGSISTSNVVCAAGAWAAKVASLAGVDIPVIPLRRQLTGAIATEPLPENGPMVIDLSNGFHFRQDRNSLRNHVLLAWPDPDEQTGYNTNYDSQFTTKILARASNRVPSWSNLEIDKQRCRAGLYEMTPDHHAIIGEAPGVRGFFLVNGFSGHGVMHSPAAGRMAAEMVLYGESRFMDASPLRLERFAENRLIHESAVI
jgi:sarcosine oxidase subunit beta